MNDDDIINEMIRSVKRPNSKPNGIPGFAKFLLVLFAGFILIAVLLTLIVIVPAGNVGVKDTFGSVDSDVLQPGLHLKGPFTNVIMFSTQTQKYLDTGTPGQNDVATITALSNEGLAVTMEIAITYHIDPSHAPELYKTVGVDYQSVIMKQPIHSVPRDIISKYDAKTLYSAVSNQSADNTDRVKIEQELFNGISKGVLKDNGSGRGIVIEYAFIRSIDLPKNLKDAITQKLQTEQAIQQKDFEVQVAKKEAERKVAEAHGIAEANQIISSSLTDQYLKWYWVENEKDNPSAIYVVSGDNPFPFVKNIDNTGKVGV